MKRAQESQNLWHGHKLWARMLQCKHVSCGKYASNKCEQARVSVCLDLSDTEQPTRRKRRLAHAVVKRGNLRSVQPPGGQDHWSLQVVACVTNFFNDFTVLSRRANIKHVQRLVVSFLFRQLGVGRSPKGRKMRPSWKRVTFLKSKWTCPCNTKGSSASRIFLSLLPMTMPLGTSLPEFYPSELLQTSCADTSVYNDSSMTILKFMLPVRGDCWTWDQYGSYHCCFSMWTG